MRISDWSSDVCSSDLATMPLYRWRELTFMADKAEIAVAICDWRLRDEMETTLQESRQLRTCRYFYAEGPESLESLMAAKPATFETADTALAAARRDGNEIGRAHV